MTIIVHHLNESRSQRVLWLLEELQLPYEIVTHQRDPRTRLSPASLLAVHPLGKAPVVIDEGRMLIESGAIIDSLIRRRGGGRLRPAPGTDDEERYLQWLHYAEGSAMLPLMLRLYTMRLGEAATPLAPRIESEIANHLGYVEAALADAPFLVGDALTGADIQMSFAAEIAQALGRAEPYARMRAWLAGLQARPAYRAAVARGGAYAMGGAG